MPRYWQALMQQRTLANGPVTAILDHDEHRVDVGDIRKITTLPQHAHYNEFKQFNSLRLG